MSRELFLTEVLSATGYNALQDACAGASDLQDLVLLRSISGWVDLVSRSGHDGVIPGTEVNASFAKSDTGFTGTVDLDNQRLYFENRSPEYVCSLVTVVVAPALKPMVYPKSQSIAKLGKSIDCLLKVKLVENTLEKDAGRSKAAAPIEAIPPEPPLPMQPPQVKTGLQKKLGLRKMLKLKLKKNYVDIACAICKEKMFTKTKFLGCDCVEAQGVLLKNDNAIPTLEFGANWSPDEVLELLEVIYHEET